MWWTKLLLVLAVVAALIVATYMAWPTRHQYGSFWTTSATDKRSDAGKRQADLEGQALSFITDGARMLHEALAQ